MPERKPKIFLLNSVEHFEHFHANLSDTLAQLGCCMDVTTSWDQAVRHLKATMAPYSLLLVDMSADGFNHESAASFLSEKFGANRPRLVTIQVLPDFEPSKFEELTTPDGVLAKTYTSHEIAFILNPFLFVDRDNKRRWKRVLAAVNIDVGETSSDRKIRAETFNLSVGGAFIRSYSPPVSGKEIPLVIDLPDGGAPIGCEARVAYSRAYSLGEKNLNPPGMGVEFKSLPQAEVKRLNSYIQYRLRMTEPKSAKAG